MDKAYVRRALDTNQFHLTFVYENSNQNARRQFNFCRQLSEPVSNFLGRVSANVEKVVNKKNKKKQNLEPQKINTILKLNNEKVDDTTECQQVFNQGGDLKLIIEDSSYKVVVDSPWIDAMSLPTSIMATYPLYPSKFEAFNTNKSLSKFVWLTSQDQVNWKECFNGYLFTPPNTIIGSYVKLVCTPSNGTTEGPAVEIESENKVDASPGLCPFEERHKYTENLTGNNEFRVVTYNILADLYCDSDFTRQVLHPYCPSYALEIDYRKQLFIKEILGYNSDIICLQEVDRKIFKYDLEPIFSHLSYGCELAFKGGEVAEGVACFYRKDKFRKLESCRLVFSDHISKDDLFKDIWEKVSLNTNLVNRILERTTTLQITVLQNILNTDKIILVANTHFYFHPDADHIRLLHGGFSIRYIENFKENLMKQHPNKQISVIFCGDFNSTPDCGVYKLFTSGYVPSDCVDFKSNADEAISNLELKQSISLESACGTPDYTNFTSGFTGCLDYIYYDKKQLKVVQSIPLPRNEQLIENTALPSIVFPSEDRKSVV